MAVYIAELSIRSLGASGALQPGAYGVAESANPRLPGVRISAFEGGATLTYCLDFKGYRTRLETVQKHAGTHAYCQQCGKASAQLGVTEKDPSKGWQCFICAGVYDEKLKNKYKGDHIPPWEALRRKAQKARKAIGAEPDADINEHPKPHGMRKDRFLAHADTVYYSELEAETLFREHIEGLIGKAGG